MGSTANVNVQNIQLSPMRVSASGVDLGGTEGGVTFMVKTDLADIHVDQYGKTVLDSKVLGHVFAVKFTLAETLDPAKWKKAFPHAKLVGTSPTQMIYFDMQVGDSLRDHATAWAFHPLDKADGDLSDDIKLFLAASKSASEVKYGPDKQVGLAIELQVFPDTAVNPPRFVIHGDPSIGVVNASAAAAVAGSNTGNGTVSAPAASNSLSVTETITITAIGTGASSANLFSVVGSVSGPLGTLSLASTNGSTANFSPTMPKPDGYVSFTLNQGTVQFVRGDSFTIAVTGANYS